MEEGGKGYLPRDILRWGVCRRPPLLSLPPLSLSYSCRSVVGFVVVAEFAAAAAVVAFTTIAALVVLAIAAVVVLAVTAVVASAAAPVVVVVIVSPLVVVSQLVVVVVISPSLSARCWDLPWSPLCACAFPILVAVWPH